MSKFALVLLVLLPLALSASTEAYLEVSDLDHLSNEDFFASAMIEMMAVETNATTPATTDAAAAPATAPATQAANATTNASAPVPEPPKKRNFKPLTRAKPKPKPRAKPVPRRVLTANKNRKGKVKPPARLPNTVAAGYINFNIKVPPGDWSKNPVRFNKRLMIELTKALNLPARRFTIINIRADKETLAVELRINPIHRLDNRAAPHAQDVCSTFKNMAMDDANVWRNLPILAHVDRSKPITCEVKALLPPPKEKPIKAQMRINVDVRMIEPLTEEFLKAFELDVATATGAEPEQIRVNDMTPDEDGTSLDHIIISFDIFPRYRDMPEKEITPTAAINTLRRQLIDLNSPLRRAPITKNADAFFPLQDINPKPKPLGPNDWMHIPKMYTTATILSDPPTYERPIVLPTLMVMPPPTPTPTPK